MDIQKERAVFEKLPDINAILHNSEFGFNEGINQYYHPNHAEHRLSYAFLMGAWLAWQAKSQVVPEGFVLVPKEPTPKMIDATWNYDDEIQDMSHNTRNEFIYKAMIEAQELAND